MIRYEATPIDDLWVAVSEPIGDARGRFARFFCETTHAQATGNPFQVLQMNESLTAQKGTIRGLHFQRAPALEGKIVRCIRGRVLDVAVDLRTGSRTFLKHFAVELSADNVRSLIIPPGFAHGFQTLEDNCEMLYLHSALYSKVHEGGLRYDDPALSIAWPLPVSVLSDRDSAFGYIQNDFTGITHEV